ncbi:MAG: DUF1707 SHOCT-like domain-containing protein [Spirochaetia bacterium]
MSSPDRTGNRPVQVITETTRQQFIDRISEAYARDYLTEDEFEQRLDNANSAHDLRQLRRLVHDLPEPTGQGRSSASEPALASPHGEFLPQGNYELAQYAPAEHDTVVCVFSGSDRKGGTPARTIRSINVFGGADFDFRGAQLLPGSTYTVDCIAVFGGADIKVPKGVNVEVHGMGIFGGFDGATQRADPRAPTIKVRGFALFGGVDIKIKD